MRVPRVYYSAIEAAEQDAPDKDGQLTLAPDGTPMRAVLLLQDLSHQVLLEEEPPTPGTKTAPDAKTAPASPSKASRSAIEGGGADAKVNEFIEFEPLADLAAAAAAAAAPSPSIPLPPPSESREVSAASSATAGMR